MTRASFPSRSDKSAKRTLGRTQLEQTPVVIRSSIGLADSFQRRIRRQLARRIGHVSRLVERGTVRFEDINGPKGGVDTVCRIKVVMPGRPSLVIEKRATSPQKAFADTLQPLATTLTRMLGKHELRAGTRRVSSARRTVKPAAARSSRKSTPRSANRGKRH